jgi:hypothetical protein
MQPTDFDEETFAYTRTDFACPGVMLAAGTNTVIVRATDLAGNQQTLTLNYTGDYSGDQTPPELVISWPGNGELLGGSGYTIDCQVSEPSARLWAVVSAGGSAAEVNGVVFANGRGYIGGVPLFAGVNSVEVHAQDPAGNEAQVALTVEPGAVQLAIDPITVPAGARELTVTGTVSAPSHSVTVNGVAATVGGDGYWTAAGVPVVGEEPVFLRAVAAPPGQPQNPSAQQSGTAEKAPRSYEVHSRERECLHHANSQRL